MNHNEKVDAVNGLRAAVGKYGLSTIRTANPEGNFIEERVAFEKNDEETKARILREQGENREAIEQIRLEKAEEEKTEKTCKKLYAQHKGGAARSNYFKRKG